MPCYYTGSAEGDRQLALQEASIANNKDSENLITKLTTMLCFLCDEIDNGEAMCWVDIDGCQNKDVIEFWQKHKILDEKKKEEMKKKAKDKLDKYLSKEEQKLLGIKV